MLNVSEEKEKREIQAEGRVSAWTYYLWINNLFYLFVFLKVSSPSDLSSMWVIVRWKWKTGFQYFASPWKEIHQRSVTPQTASRRLSPWQMPHTRKRTKLCVFSGMSRSVFAKCRTTSVREAAFSIRETGVNQMMREHQAYQSSAALAGERRLPRHTLLFISSLFTG